MVYTMSLNQGADAQNKQKEEDNLPEKSEYGTDKNKIRSHFIVAPSFGNLTSESCLLMDDNLKRSLFLVSKRIDNIIKLSDSCTISWETLLQTMMQCPFVEKDESKDISIHESKYSSMRDWFNYYKYTYTQLQEETFEWLKEKISNPDYIKVIGEDKLKELSKTYATYGSDVDNAGEFFYDTEEDEMKLLDIGIVRYPSVSRPYIELFRIEIYSKRDETKVLTFGSVDAEITLDMHSKKFVPNNDMLNKINKDMTDVIDREFKKMIADLGI